MRPLRIFIVGRFLLAAAPLVRDGHDLTAFGRS